VPFKFDLHRYTAVHEQSGGREGGGGSTSEPQRGAGPGSGGAGAGAEAEAGRWTVHLRGGGKREEVSVTPVNVEPLSRGAVVNFSAAAYALMVGTYPKCHARMLAKVPKIPPKYPNAHAQILGERAKNTDKVPKNVSACPCSMALSRMGAKSAHGWLQEELNRAGALRAAMVGLYKLNSWASILPLIFSPLFDSSN
jgi:hypothetical protein